LSCDGCAADCSRVDDVCGDGIRECGEQCDDGNTTSGDGCNADCTLPAAAELLVQGSPQSQGCQAEWKLHMSNGQLGTSGLPTRTQKCTDNDPACDHDGLNDLRCSYEAQVCLRVTDPRLPACQPAALDWIRISNPSPYSDDPIKAQNGQAILDALEPFGLPIYVLTTLVQPGVPFASIDQCTDSFTMVVPRAQNGTGKKTFNIVAQDVEGDRMQANSDPHLWRQYGGLRQ
jgi:cysteine-rich repeat protein